MRYFKNSELARMYGISEKTVRNWIKSAQTGNLGLDIYVDEKNRPHVAETTKNELLIQRIIEENKKYVNSRTHKHISPHPDFYRNYTEIQRLDIVNSLEKFNEIPFYYVHVGDGAEVCANYYARLEKESLNSQSYSADFLYDNYANIMKLFKSSLFNFVELGGRTGFTARKFILDLREHDLLNKYIDIDISRELLLKNADNLKLAIGTERYNSFQRDVVRERFDDILVRASLDPTTRNLVVMLGGIMSAFNDKKGVYRNIFNSMCQDDCFILTSKIDSSRSRRYFDFDPIFGKKLIPQKDQFLTNMIGLNESLFDLEQFYDTEEKARKIQARLKFDITLNFELEGKIKKIEFSKGESILLWRVWHQTMEEIVQEMTECGFNVMQATKSPDEQYAMITAKIKTDKVNHR